eukprot:CAMPEP_0113320406 /NCGR_PEP_ID=MMETSP0010_2-20120614/14238_1 /TAXON_ID=216773 ORGANISM="Corethron hystrix, Strain 308" /NCGR_SAMPLE_ID=MMETSP0010_2 /ASSEMBLY_ACC=CAM_ASM_000155 /LENGTH=178 /DNA_ID=CAMNT_0000178203 /DNA_START=17 /DNA_END=550 /DNA_ORIENTATION=- /assembly_acc=CAM_ASM_000155
MTKIISCDKENKPCSTHFAPLHRQVSYNSYFNDAMVLKSDPSLQPRRPLLKKCDNESEESATVLKVEKHLHDNEDSTNTMASINLLSLSLKEPLSPPFPQQHHLPDIEGNSIFRKSSDFFFDSEDSLYRHRVLKRANPITSYDSDEDEDYDESSIDFMPDTDGIRNDVSVKRTKTLCT